ncbi:MAG TPA: glyoxylate/hydroxypyruvate reductase A [Terriglobia bacterium]|nr:glyoxylate/hydroxypyruvate reductase A [Terriglobia bacterium]
MTILYAGDADEAEQWLSAIREIDASLCFRRWPDHGPASEIDFIIVGGRLPGDFASFTRLRAIQSTWAGVNHLMQSGTLPAGVPIARMVDNGLTCSMTEYLVFQVLDHLRRGPELRQAQRAGHWLEGAAATPRHGTIGIMGLGALGQDAARQFAALGLPLRGWSRTAKTVPHVACYAGAAELPAFLAGCDVLICLLPLTPDTRGILSAVVLAQLPAGACLINAARGPHLVEADLLAALDSGHLSRAVLDVFHAEPLPAEHAFWRHPRITVTPHIAAITRAGTGAALIVENYRRALAGQELINQVDRQLGY